MSDCCESNAGNTCSLPQGTPGNCPECGGKGHAVGAKTVKNLVRGHTRVAPSTNYFFCRNPICEVVYFSADGTFHKPDVKVRVGIKETGDSAPLCYCFDYQKADVRRDIAATGTTNIPERIKQEVQGGFCACEVKNPSGKCCLGNISAAILEIQRERD